MTQPRVQCAAFLLAILVLNQAVQAQVAPAESGTESTAIVADPVLVIKVSERFLTDLLRKPLTEDTNVNTTIIGKPVRGKAFTYGRLYLDFVESHDHAKFWLLFAGQTTAHTTGYNDPAYIHSTAVTRFITGKELTYDTDDHLEFAPAKVEADTTRYPRGISSSLPGLRGRIVKRVAARRLAEYSGQIQLESSLEARNHVKESFDRQTHERLGPLRERLSGLIPLIQEVVENRGLAWNLASSEHHLIIAASEHASPDSPRPTTLVGLALPEPPIDDALIEVWQHSRFNDVDPDAFQSTYRMLRFVFRAIARSETFPADLRTNFKSMAEFDAAASKHREWSVIQLYRPE